MIPSNICPLYILQEGAKCDYKGAPHRTTPVQQRFFSYDDCQDEMVYRLLPRIITSRCSSSFGHHSRRECVRMSYPLPSNHPAAFSKEHCSPIYNGNQSRTRRQYWPPSANSVFVNKLVVRSMHWLVGVGIGVLYR
jgi:hypothetical protein